MAIVANSVSLDSVQATQNILQTVLDLVKASPKEVNETLAAINKSLEISEDLLAKKTEAEATIAKAAQDTKEVEAKTKKMEDNYITALADINVKQSALAKEVAAFEVYKTNITTSSVKQQEKLDSDKLAIAATLKGLDASVKEVNAKAKELDAKLVEADKVTAMKEKFLKFVDDKTAELDERDAALTEQQQKLRALLG